MGAITQKYSFWWDNSAPDFALQPQLPAYADLVIVGAGFAGMSTAYWVLRLVRGAKKKKLRVVVLDEAPHPAFKATGRMNGSIYIGSNRPAKAVADDLGEKVAKQLFHYGNRNNIALRDLVERGLACDAQFNGGFRMSSTAKQAVQLEDSAELLNKWGFYPARFDHDQSQHVMVVPYVKSSLFTPGEGMFDPFVFTNRLTRLLRKNGVWVVYGARVAGASNSADGPQIQLDNGHVMTAGKIVHTTSKTVPWDRAHENIVHRREHVIRTEPLSADLDEMPLPLMPVELHGGLESIRIHDRAVIMTGGKAGLKNDPELGVTDDTSSNERVLGQLDKTMLHNFPITNHMEVSHQWTYIETATKDDLPLMGELPEHPGQFVNVAHNRNKFGLAFLGAKNIAQRILRMKMTDQEFKIFDPKRLTRGE